MNNQGSKYMNINVLKTAQAVSGNYRAPEQPCTMAIAISSDGKEMFIKLSEFKDLIGGAIKPDTYISFWIDIDDASNAIAGAHMYEGAWKEKDKETEGKAAAVQIGT